MGFFSLVPCMQVQAAACVAVAVLVAFARSGAQCGQDLPGT